MRGDSWTLFLACTVQIHCAWQYQITFCVIRKSAKKSTLFIWNRGFPTFLSLFVGQLHTFRQRFACFSRVFHFLFYSFSAGFLLFFIQHVLRQHVFCCWKCHVQRHEADLESTCVTRSAYSLVFISQLFGSCFVAYRLVLEVPKKTSAT